MCFAFSDDRAYKPGHVEFANRESGPLMEKPGPQEKQSLSGEVGQRYTVTLPFPPEAFREFISGLLGQPQTLERRFLGTFELSRPDVETIFHLVDQRVKQQNEASLIQFTIKIIYDDNSSVLLNSIDDFVRYTEVRPVVSVAAHLSWTYLIKFQDRAVPEKQENLVVLRYTDLFAVAKKLSG